MWISRVLESQPPLAFVQVGKWQQKHGILAFALTTYTLQTRPDQCQVPQHHHYLELPVPPFNPSVS